MNQRFFNRILHLLEERPEQGKRMIGLGAPALWAGLIYWSEKI
jgi:hypothetical protein